MSSPPATIAGNNHSATQVSEPESIESILMSRIILSKHNIPITEIILKYLNITDREVLYKVDLGH